IGHDRQASLDRQRLPQFQLSHCLRRNRRGACDRSARSPEMPCGGQARGLEHHADPEHARAPRPYRWQRVAHAEDRCKRGRAPARPRQDSREVAAGVSAGDVIKVGRTVELEALDTPGHTMSHVCVLSHTDQRALFSGDTLFNAGAGNCHNGGHPEELYKTFSQQLAKLPENTLIYPGHDYIENNLRFTLSREPDNRSAQAMLEKLKGQDPNRAYVSTLAVEREINTFFRLTSPSVIAKLREAFPELPEKPDARMVFLKLRELRNKW